MGLSSLVTIKTKDDYYKQNYATRARILNVPNRNTGYLCKTIIMRNKAVKQDAENSSELLNDPTYPLFIGVIIQYVTKLHSGKLSEWMKNYQNNNTKTNIKLSKRAFHYRVADQEESYEISRCEYNGVTPFEFNHEKYGKVPIVLSENILKLNPQSIYLGAGEFITKFGISVEDFKKYHGENLIIGDIIES